MNCAKQEEEEENSKYTQAVSESLRGRDVHYAGTVVIGFVCFDTSTKKFCKK